MSFSVQNWVHLGFFFGVFTTKIGSTEKIDVLMYFPERSPSSHSEIDIKRLDGKHLRSKVSPVNNGPSKVVPGQDQGERPDKVVSPTDVVQQTVSQVTQGQQVQQTAPQVTQGQQVQQTAPQVTQGQEVQQTAPQVTQGQQVQQTAPQETQGQQVQQTAPQETQGQPVKQTPALATPPPQEQTEAPAEEFTESPTTLEELTEAPTTAGEKDVPNKKPPQGEGGQVIISVEKPTTGSPDCKNSKKPSACKTEKPDDTNFENDGGKGTNSGNDADKDSGQDDNKGTKNPQNDKDASQSSREQDHEGHEDNSAADNPSILHSVVVHLSLALCILMLV